MVILRKNLISLIDEVVLLFEDYIFENDDLKQYLHSDEIRAKHDIGITKLAIKLINDSKGAEAYFIKGAEAHKELNISVEIMQHYLTLFFKLHKRWCEINFMIEKEHYDSLIEKFDKLFMKTYKNCKEEDDKEDGFLLFESEEVDEAIEQMHYKDTHKITAKEYLSFGEILEDDLHSILETKDESEDISDSYEMLNEEFLKEFIHMIQRLAKVLFSTHEFKDIGYTINNFIIELQNLNLDDLNNMQKEFAFTVLKQLNEDIHNWIENIFVNQDAIDIHYFDASFLANIAQFGIMLDENSSENVNSESEDDFLF